jgi:cysteine desulfurase/selenocysteine lyase
MLNESERMRDFPGLGETTYLNTAAECIPPKSVGLAMERYFHDKLLGMRGRELHFAEVELCREVSARFLGLSPQEVSFCSCSSEAYNLLSSALQLRADDEVVVSDLDFPAGVTPWLRSEPRPVLKLWRAENGELRPESLIPLLNSKTRLVQVSLVSFYNGHRLEWSEVCRLVRAQAPGALISVDITQALGRVAIECPGADILISSTHKWALGIHGGCVVGVRSASAERLTTRAGGWFHLRNAFDGDRFERADSKNGAFSYSVGMPNFVAIYALNEGLRYLESKGLQNIESRSGALVRRLATGLEEIGVDLLCPWNGSGIVAFRHPRSEQIQRALEERGVHVMYNAGRLRASVHGYNTTDDIDRFLNVVEPMILAG